MIYGKVPVPSGSEGNAENVKRFQILLRFHLLLIKTDRYTVFLSFDWLKNDLSFMWDVLRGKGVTIK